jgi:hypothetical protein
VKNIDYSSQRLTFILNVGAFVYLLEFWVVSLHGLNSHFYLPRWMTEWLWMLVQTWPDLNLEFFYALFDQVTLVVIGALLWILPYRFLPFLRPLKTIPYLWVASLATIGFLLLDRRVRFEVFDLSLLDQVLGEYVIFYLLPPALFHYYFRRRAAVLAQSERDVVKL